MSLILDALRKSEAERRRGQMPDLRAELPPPIRATGPSRRAWPLWFAASAVLVAAATLAWSQWASRAGAPPDAGGSAAIASAETADVPPPVPARIAPATPVEAAPAPAPRPAEPVQTVPAPVAPDPGLARTEPVEPTAPRETTPPTAPAVAAANEPAPPVAPSAPAIATPPPASVATVRLADLSPGEREQLPPLKISMHMWGPAPEQRFAIIDGTRVGQGDRVGDAVVEEILAEGVVLDWHGRRLSLPLR